MNKQNQNRFTERDQTDGCQSGEGKKGEGEYSQLYCDKFAR